MEAIQLQNHHETQFLTPKLSKEQVSLDGLISELRDLVTHLGKGGGILTPSIYDTAQVLRFASPEEGVEPAFDWLLNQQEEDGGWGNPIALFMRDVPTLAAILALHQYNESERYGQAIQAGLEFLNEQSRQWEDFSVDELLVGVELILPTLIEEAVQKKLELTFQPYRKLIQLGKQKRKIFQYLKVIRGTPAAFSWEAWGEFPNRYLLDSLHSVGSSTSATAAWIAKSRAFHLPFDLSDSMNYLRLASKATGLDIPGVVPFAWPIDRFEQSFSLYAIAIGGLLNHPAVADVIHNQLANLSTALTPYGMPFSDHFIPDLDDTAASIVVFRMAGIDVEAEVLNVFKNGTGYFTYPGELHASTSAHARAVHALALLAENDLPRAQKVLLQFQSSDGAWPADKWHKSWLYTTSHILYALQSAPDWTAVERGLRKLVSRQNDDGGWGINHHSTTAETAYVMLAFQLYRKQKPYLEYAYRRGQTWLLENIHRKPVPQENLWIGKELFKPYRIDRAFELTALIQSILEP